MKVIRKTLLSNGQVQITWDDGNILICNKGDVILQSIDRLDKAVQSFNDIQLPVYKTTQDHLYDEYKMFFRVYIFLCIYVCIMALT